MRPLDHVLAWCSGHIPGLTARSQRLLYRLTGGHLGGKLPGYQLLWLTTTGRRTGRKYTWPLLYFTDGENLVVLASNNGADTHPNWYLNLLKTPQATVEMHGVKRTLVASTADSAERARLWPVALRTFPLYEVVARRTQRQIPVVLLR
jgi:deazaflavin-dependent oxidoreductase (nitroreductase family)